MSPIPGPKAWDIDALNIDWMGLTTYPFPPSAHLHRVILKQAIQLSDHTNTPRLTRDALVLGPSAALNRDPTAIPSVNNTPKQSHNYVLHTTRNSSTSSPGVWEWITPRTCLLCGSGRESLCTSAVINKDHLQIKVGPL